MTPRFWRATLATTQLYTHVTVERLNIADRIAVMGDIPAEAQAIQTEDAETGQVVNRRFINDLPLIDRNVIALTSLAPGVTEMDH